MEDKKLSRKILLVDDDADDRQFFMEAVHEIDPSVECVTAKDGKQALRLLHDDQVPLPDFIFLDLRMPKVDGRQCLLQIKANERLKSIPVFVYTTSSEVRESEELQNLGAVRFLTKPANTEEIYYVVSQVLEEEDIHL